eukprot:1709975-Pleurochrysis_carterae.AAC.2
MANACGFRSCEEVSGVSCVACLVDALAATSSREWAVCPRTARLLTYVRAGVPASFAVDACMRADARACADVPFCATIFERQDGFCPHAYRKIRTSLPTASACSYLQS